MRLCAEGRSGGTFFEKGRFCCIFLQREAPFGGIGEGGLLFTGRRPAGKAPPRSPEPGAVLRRPFDGLYALRLYYLYKGAQNAVEKIETEGVL